MHVGRYAVCCVYEIARDGKKGRKNTKTKQERWVFPLLFATTISKGAEQSRRHQKKKAEKKWPGETGACVSQCLAEAFCSHAVCVFISLHFTAFSCILLHPTAPRWLRLLHSLHFTAFVLRVCCW